MLSVARAMVRASVPPAGWVVDILAPMTAATR
jgi:hypothetical protein